MNDRKLAELRERFPCKNKCGECSGHGIDWTDAYDTLETKLTDLGKRNEYLRAELKAARGDKNEIIKKGDIKDAVKEALEEKNRELANQILDKMRRNNSEPT
jgi:hypothetical protein